MYYCRVQAVDNAGNTGAWSASSDGVMVDSMPPSTPGTPTDAGAYTTSTSVTFNWTAATDSGSGLQSYRCEIDTTPGGSNVFGGNLTPTTLSRTVAGSNGNTYYCRVRARDNAGSYSSWSGNSDGITVDTTVPAPGTASSPASVTGGTISVDYSGASDSTSGLKKVELWHKKETVGVWTNTGLTLNGASGTFGFTPASGSGTYYFDLVAEDNAGNRSAAASGSGDTSTIYTATYTIAGRITLGDYAGDITQVPVTVELRKGGQVTTRTINLQSDGSFVIDGVTVGTYDIAFKAGHWLQRVIGNVSVGP